MDKEQLINAAKKIAISNAPASSILAESVEFLRIYAGEKSAFYKQLKDANPLWLDARLRGMVISTLNAFVSFYESGLADGISIERRAQIDV